MTKYTLEAVTAAMKAVVEEKGADYVYPRALSAEPCLYVEPGTKEPSCIVGHVVARISLDDFEKIAEYEAKSMGGSLNANELGRLFHDDELEYDEDLNYALLDAQRAQDRGATWGEALAAYLREIDLIGQGDES